MEELSNKRFAKTDAEGRMKKMEELIAGKDPSTGNTTKAVKAGGVDRLTDTSKYTGIVFILHAGHTYCQPTGAK